jgi:hypothetical protein
VGGQCETGGGALEVHADREMQRQLSEGRRSGVYEHGKHIRRVGVVREIRDV